MSAQTSACKEVSCVPDSPQLAHRHAFESLPLDDGREAQVVGLPFQVVDDGKEGGRAETVNHYDPMEFRNVQGLAVGAGGSYSKP